LLAYVYDDAHRLTEIHDELGNKIAYTLDGMGNRTAEQTFDPTGTLARTRTRVYDSLNRLSQDVGAQSQATVMTYDGNGNRLTSTDPLSHTTTSTYDSTVCSPSHSWRTADPVCLRQASNLTTVTGRFFGNHSYDGLKWSLASRSTAGVKPRPALRGSARPGSSQTPSETHTYVGWRDGRRRTRRRLTKLVDPSGTTKWTYAARPVASRDS
jgi:YD repeat-containing protein